MRVPPQVNERVKEAPAQALRAMFAGLGQLLSVADQIRNKAAAARPPAAAKTAAPETTATREPSAAPEAKVAPETSAAPETKIAPEPKVAQETSAAPETTDTPETKTPEAKIPETKAPETTRTPKHARPSTPASSNVRVLPPEEAAAAAAAASAPAAPAAQKATSGAAAPAELPLANYDDLTIASLRARLRNLSADQLNELIAYEKSHAGRADVITMFERRIAKLAEG